MSNVLILTDIHKGVRNDLAAAQRQQAKFDSMIMDIIDDPARQIDTIMIPGDVFDRRKYVNFVSLGNAANSLFDPLAARVQSGKIRVVISPGNHDLYYRNNMDFCSLPLLLSGYPFDIIMQPKEIAVGGSNLLMLPWINVENHDETLKTIAASSAPYCLGHLELYGFEMHRGEFSTGGMDPGLFRHFQWVGSGHYHHRSIKDNIHYLGATYQFTWSDYNDPRGATLLNPSTGYYEFINNPFEMFHVIYYDDEKNSAEIQSMIDGDLSKYTDCFVKIRIHSKKNTYLFERLIEKLQNVNPIKVSIIEETLDISNIEIDGETTNLDDTPTLISKYIDELKLSKNTDKLKELMLHLHREAISLENIE